jgi:hypothetical protein
MAYLVKRTRFFYGPKEETLYKAVDDTFFSFTPSREDARRFTKAQAEAFVENAGNGVYELAHNESSRPEWTIVQA